MKKDFFSNKKSIVAIFSIVFLLVSLSLIFKSQAQELAESSLSAFLKVKEYALFGGGVTIGLNNPINALIVQSGKVGIGTTNPTSLLTVNGDVEITGTINPSLDCPFFFNIPVYGHKSWPTDGTLTRYSGFIPSQGVTINEFSAGNDERLSWVGCVKGGICHFIGCEQSDEIIGFSNIGIIDGSPDSIFKAGNQSTVFAAFKYVESTNPSGIGVVRIADTTTAKTAFCQELGMQLDTSIQLIPESTSGPCRTFNTSTNVWESVSCSGYANDINCRM